MKIRDWKTGGGYLRGIDISAYQGTVNYAKVKSSGIKFVILRAYGSANSPDQKIVEYAKGFKNVGIPCGSYFFCTISNEYDLESAKSQANKYADKLEQAFGQGSWGQLLPFLDLENNENVGGRHASLNTTQMLVWVDQFRKTFEARFGNKVKLGLYSNWGFIQGHNNFNNGSGGNILKDMPLWVAKWRTTSIPDVGGWTNWVAWQYTDNASPFANGQTVGVSSTGLDMNYVESLDHITSINSSSQSIALSVSRPIASLTATNSIEVKWVAPTISGVKKLEIYRNGIKLGDLDKSSTYFHDRAIEDGRSYSYHLVIFTDKDQTTSEISNLITTRNVQSDKPSGLYGQAFDRQIILTWQPNETSNKVKGYSVYMDGKKIDYTEDTTYTFKGLTNGKIYKFQVQAHNQNPQPSALSDPLEVSPILKRPFPPSVLSTKVRANGEIYVSWSYYKDEDFDHFYVVMDGNVKGNYLQDTNFTIKNVEVDIQHSIYVGAVDKQGDITTSNTLTRTLHQPPQIKGLKGTPFDRRVTIQWNKPNFYFSPPLPPIPPTPEPQPEGSIFYIVQENDSIDDIAEKHGTDYSLVVAWNYDLMERSLIAGETLYLFVDIPQGTMLHTVTQNDTFTSVAEENGMTTDELKAYNPNVDVDLLVIGSQLVVFNQTQPRIPTTIKYRIETKTRIIQKTVTETKQVATTKLIEPPVTSYEKLKQNALTLTALFETSLGFPQAYGRTAGNFDGAGMSFGAIQFNFKSGTLQPILKAMFDNHTNVVKTAFNYNSNPSYFNKVKSVVYNMTRSQQINWGSSITVGTGIESTYKSYFYNLGITPECIALQVKGAESYFAQAKNHFKKFGLTTRRAFALCFDIAIQNWSISSTTASRIFSDFNSISSGLSHNEKETKKMQIIANRRAEASNSQWIEDVRKRKLAIANGTGTVHGFYINTADYDLILEPAFFEDQGTFAVPQTTYETIEVSKVIDVEEQYTVQTPYIVPLSDIPEGGEPFEEKEVILEPPAEVDNYFIYQNSELIGIVDGNTNSFEVTGLENGKTYEYSIQAISTQDLKSPISQNISLTPMIDYPNKAYNLQAEIKDKTTILFSWELEDSPNLSHLEVYLNGKVVSTDSTINTVNYIEAKQNFDYTLEIVTYDFEGDSVSSGIILQRINIPDVPKNLKTVSKDREILLTWDSNEEEFVKFYNIYLDGEINAVVESTENSYKVIGLENNVLYDFRIQAVGENTFTSLVSDAIFETPLLDIPNVPNITYHKELGTGGIDLHWEHVQKEGHSYYNVYKNGYLYASNITELSYRTDYLESNVIHTFQVEAFDFQEDRSGFSNSYPVTIYAKILEPLSTNLGKVDKEMPVSKPKIFLCKPNKKVIAHLNEAYGIIYNTRYADLNEITFNIPFQMESTTNELIENPHYKMMKERFLIKLEYRHRTEYFIINQISNFGENNAKQIHAWSLGYELKDKLITNFKEEIYTAHSAFLVALETSINWRIGANIKNLDFYWNRERRIFAVSNQTVLDFIIQIAKSFNAILVWDTVNRIVDFENPLIEDVNRGLKIKYGKYLKTLSKTSSIEEMVTHLRPIGENNLSISEATINGEDYLEDFSYFMQGFETENEELANFYSYSRSIVRDPLDNYYVEYMGFSTVPKGAIFLTVDSTTGKVSDTINMQVVAKALITNLKLYKSTLDKVYLENAQMFAEFLNSQRTNADYLDYKFFVLPDTLNYDRTSNEWKPDVSKIYLQTLYITSYAFLELFEYEIKDEYLELVESILSFLSFAYHNVGDRIASNNLAEGFEGLIYDNITNVGIATDEAYQYLLSWNLFDNVALWHFAKTWNKYIELFSNNQKVDLVGNSYNPQDILEATLNFYNQEYLNGRILMTPTGLPYQYYHYYAPPITEDEQYSLIEDNVLTVDILNGVIANDSDIDSEDLTTILVTTTANGELTLNGDGSFEYIPNQDFYGTDTFTYKVTDGALESNISTVTITVSPVNDPPVALNNIYVMNEDTVLNTTLTNGVLSNDYDVDNIDLTISLITTTVNGALVFNTDGTFQYTPNANFYGTDSFTYKISDGLLESEIATATITINNVNDAPVGVNNWYTTNEDTILNVTTTYSVLNNDTDIDNTTLTAVLVSGTTNGALTLNANGSFQYTPNTNWNGTDSFIYKVSDGTAQSANTTVYIEVKPINDRPVATNNTYVMSEDTILTTTTTNGVLANDTDAENSPLTAILVTTTTNGALVFNTNGTFTYTPNANFYGTDSFTYKVSEGSLESDVGTVTITVNNVNDIPVSANDSYTVNEDTILNVDVANGVLKNDTDIETSSLTAVLVTTTTKGQLTLNSNGSFQYTPNANFNGTDSFTYKASDGTAQSSTSTVTITVTAIADTQPANTTTYTVVSGDTFSVIASRYGLTSTQLQALNPDIVNTNALYVGQIIYVPVPKAPNVPSNITPTSGATSNNLTVSANVSDQDSSQVKLIVEASLSSAFTGTVVRKESALVNSGTITSITLDGFDFNTISTTVWLRIKASDGSLESSVVNSSFIYKVPQPANTTIYTVVGEETLSEIAVAHNTTVPILLSLNPMVEEMNIYSGQQIYVPIEEVELTKTYTVLEGDTFSSIALKFDTTTDHIQELNPTASPMNVYAGLQLTVPLIERNLAYTVKEGDTFSSLAVKYGTTTERIQAVNPTVSPMNMYAGLQLTIPVPTEVYVVKTNDTISSIAVNFTTTISILTQFNPTITPNSLTVGQKIYVPSVPTSEPTMLYTVVSGDTSSKIATAHNTTVAKITELNPTIDVNMIYVGQVIVVPRTTPTESYSYTLLSEDDLKWQALLLTSQYETSTAYPNNFGVTAGNFDGAGVSWGAIQYNAKTSSLIEQWQNMINNHPTVTLKAFTDNTSRTLESNQANHDSWKALFLGGVFSEILTWADARSDTTKNKHALIEPWNTYFMNLGITQEAIDMQVEYSAWYHQVSKQWFNSLGLWSRQGYALMFDIAVQSGSMNPKVNEVVYDLIGEINNWWTTVDKTGKTIKELEVMKLVKIANRRADYIDVTWQEQYRDRKVTIAEGYGEVNGMIMDTEVKYDMGLEPAYSTNVPSQFTNLQTEFAEEFYFDANQYMTEFGGELTPLDVIERGTVNTLLPQPKNYDGINNIYGDTWFKGETVLKIAIGYSEIDLNIHAREIRNSISNLKSENYLINNEIVFFDRYTFEGIGGVDGDISKSLANTGLFMQLEELLENTEYNDRLKETISNHQVISADENLNYGFRWNVEDNNSNLSNRTLNEVVNALSSLSNMGVISSSPYMSDELCKAILSYNRLLEQHEGEFASLMLSKHDISDEVSILEETLKEKETDLFIVQDLLDRRRSDGELFYESVLYVGSSRPLEFELKKDFQYILMAKTESTDIKIITPNGTKTFTTNDEWQVIEKISFNRENESTVESSIDEYDYELALIGSTTADLEIQINRILVDEFNTLDNETDLLNRYIEEIPQKDYDQQLELVNEKKMEIANLDTTIGDLQSMLSVYNNFSAELREERELFIITKEYMDEMINNPEELKNRALEKFKELKSPIITIEIDIVNFLELIEEHYNWNKLDLGTLINILYEKFDIMIEAKIIQIDYDFDNKTITLLISNISDIKTNQEKFIEAIYGAVSTSTTVSLEKHSWSKAIEVREDFDSFVNQAFDATKQKIIAGTNETVEISRRGLLIKSDTDPLSFLVANSSVLAITNDGGRSYKNAITTEGVIAQRLIGQIIAGENLIIENKAGNFRVDSEGVTLEGQGLKIIGGLTKEHISSTTTFNTDLSAIVSTYTDVYEENNMNAVIPLSPSIIEDGTHIQYTDETYDLVNISFNWEYSDEVSSATDIDGFMIYIYTSPSSALYNFGSKRNAEITYHVSPNKRSVVLYNVPIDLYYNFGVEAYRVVDIGVNIEGVLKSPIIQASSPFNPSLEVAYEGSIVGTVEYGRFAKIKGDIITAIRQGQSYSNVTIDSNNGIIAENNLKTQKIIINEEGFKLQKKNAGIYEDVLYADQEGTLIAESLIANRLVVNDGTGTELINAHTKQINFDNFDVVTGNIHAQNVDLKGMQVLNPEGITTFSIDNNGNVSISGNVTMLGGSLLWSNLNKPTYSANEVGAKPANYVPTYTEISGTKPPTDANNTYNELLNNSNIQGFIYKDGKLLLYANYIKSGTLNADLIEVINLDAKSITTGILSGVEINVDKNVSVGDLLVMRYDTELNKSARILFRDAYQERRNANYSSWSASIHKADDFDSLVIEGIGLHLSFDVNQYLWLGESFDSAFQNASYGSGMVDVGGTEFLTKRKENGYCGIGGMNQGSDGVIAGVVVQFRLPKDKSLPSYTPTSITLTPLSTNLVNTANSLKVTQITRYGFWLYINGEFTQSGSGYRYWRGNYLG